MIIIGICGSSGSGKGYTCEKFKEHGVVHIDTDKVYTTKIVVAGSPCLNELCMFFGKGILNSDGSLNKTALASKVFEGENASQHLKVLNTITHKYIRSDVEKTIEECKKNGVSAILVDAPVLFESGFDSMCDVTICVTAPYEMKIQRVMKRDKIPRAKAIARIQSQLADERLRELCTYEIVNDDKGDLDAKIASIIRELKIDKGE
ncbi:MAG: dephospho-CoA kinase [Clostridia bacterium]|nr:dephospho-CoA kinase [Clostridia bacterium]